MCYKTNKEIWRRLSEKEEVTSFRKKTEYYTEAKWNNIMSNAICPQNKSLDLAGKMKSWINDISVK